MLILYIFYSFGETFFAEILVSLFRLFFPFVFSMFFIVHWNIFMMATLKIFVSDNYKICVILVLTSVDFSFKLKLYWFMINDFLLKSLIWVLFYETLEIILTICYSSLPLTPFCRRKRILPFWWQMKVEVYVFTRRGSFHVISRLVWTFRFQQGLHWYFPSWGRGNLYLVTSPQMASTDTIMGGMASLLWVIMELVTLH